jgi:hypothetical protein
VRAYCDLAIATSRAATATAHAGSDSAIDSSMHQLSGVHGGKRPAALALACMYRLDALSRRRSA